MKCGPQNQTGNLTPNWGRGGVDSNNLSSQFLLQVCLQGQKADTRSRIGALSILLYEDRLKIDRSEDRKVLLQVQLYVY